MITIKCCTSLRLVFKIKVSFLIKWDCHNKNVYYDIWSLKNIFSKDHPKIKVNHFQTTILNFFWIVLDKGSTERDVSPRWSIEVPTTGTYITCATVHWSRPHQHFTSSALQRFNHRLSKPHTFGLKTRKTHVWAGLWKTNVIVVYQGFIKRIWTLS